MIGFKSVNTGFDFGQHIVTVQVGHCLFLPIEVDFNTFNANSSGISYSSIDGEPINLRLIMNSILATADKY